MKAMFLRRLMAVLVPAALSLLAPMAAAEPIATNAKHVYIADFQTGAVLYDKAAEERLHPASMSKLMTVYMLFDALKRGDVKLTDTFHVSQKAWAMQGSKMFVDIDSDVKVEDLIRGMIIQSGNDACIVVAEGLAGSEEAFAERMNKKAKELGLNDSNFVNSTGWPDPNHYMTAKDIAILSRHVIVDFPEYYHYFAEKEFTWHGIKQGNRNPLLYRPGSGVDGLKTGHTEEAGYGVAASAVRDGRRIIMVVHGLNDMQERADEEGQLLDWAYRETGNYTVASKGAALAEAPVEYGASEKVPLTIAQDLVLTLPKADRQKVTAKAVVSTPIEAPVAAGQELGKLVVNAPNMPEFTYPLVAAQDVPEISLSGRIFTNLNRLIFGPAKAAQ
ncbi:MAG TPA: D-alanyl-D-alanine carboxypeptidase family protein [Dongiaceae bacterium]|jgi:D-alanyl-D-alanine carboxypeptidase (penicillin-binding protein 5/6)|nr:D-alanyl-D-alanine carboxypeptidase family protein [Dongiaceae bacterium]